MSNANKKNNRPLWDKKTRFPSLMTYADEQQIRFVLNQKSDQLLFAEFIAHDKDDKAPHYHVVLELKKPRYISEIISWFKACVDSKGRLVNTMGEATKSTEDIDDYLTHKNDLTKHQYTACDIRVLIGSRDEYRTHETEYQAVENAEAAKAFAKEAYADDVESQLQAIIDGTSHREMARRYGRDYIKNHKAYKEYALLMVVEETGELPEHLVCDPLQNLINKKCRESTEYGTERTVSALTSLYGRAMTECGLTDAIQTQVAKKIEKYIKGE